MHPVSTPPDQLRVLAYEHVEARACVAHHAEVHGRPALHATIP